MAYAGCYTLDLYCDASGHKHNYDNRGGETFTGRTKAACLRKARAAGWSFTNDRQVCPECRKKPTSLASQDA